MNNIRYYHFLALLSWAYWTGQKEVIKDVRSKRLKFFKNKTAEFNQLILKLVANLHFPVSADVPYNSNFFNTNWNDTIYRSISNMMDIPVKPFWPENYRFAFLLSHDIDRIRVTYQYPLIFFRKKQFLKGLLSIARLLRNIKIKKYPDPYQNLKKILLLENRLGVKSAFYLLKERRRLDQLVRLRPQHFFGVYDPREIKKEIELLRRQGHELALHLSLDAFHSGKSLRYEKNYMENIWPVIFKGSRTHYLMFNENTADLLLKEGFNYDASMGFNFQNGFRCGTAFPFLLRQSDNALLWEIPLNLMDTALLSCFESVKKWDEIENIVSSVMDCAINTHGVLAVNWHQRNVNEHCNPELFNLFQNIIFKAKKHVAWITTPQKLIHWWYNERPETDG